MKKMNIPVGVSDFEEIRKNGYYYIDKSGLVRELLSRTGTKVTLITRPRRFGKTLGMSMLESFFDIRKDSRALFEGLEISENQALCDAWMNQYPTIFVSFRQVDGLNFTGAYDMLTWVISADGSILPRETGVSDRPMKGSVAFHSPDSLRITLNLPGHGPIPGMAIHRGITLIVGGGYHGKSTLLKALESGVYNHIPGDGREYVITDETAVKLRAEDGRSINHVDISLFIRDLPNKKDTTCFSTADASGSTSQAAAVIESIEAGTRAFLIDEDTSATNFMLRDDLMQRIVSRDKEPITPFIERARDLYKQAGISTVLVAGSSGAYFFIAATIIQMDAYRPFDITEMVKNACEQEASKPAIQAPGFKLPTAGRKLAAGGTGRAVGAMALDFGDSRAEAGGESQEEGENSGRSGRFGNRGGSASDAGRFERGRGGRREADRNSDRNTRIKVRVHDKHSFQVAKEPVDLRFVEQLADSEQTAALAQMVRYCLEKGLLERCTVQETVATLLKAYEADGLSVFSDASYAAMGLAMPRVQEIYACLNRFRG